MSQKRLILFCIAGLIAIGLLIYCTVGYVPRNGCAATNPNCGSLVREPD